MDFKTYSDFCDTTWIGSEDKSRALLGLVEEIGELCGKEKRVLRGEEISKDLKLKEVGDILYYLDRYCKSEGSSLEECALLNINKLSDRIIRGKIKGSGDER